MRKWSVPKPKVKDKLTMERWAQQHKDHVIAQVTAMLMKHREGQEFLKNRPATDYEGWQRLANVEFVNSLNMALLGGTGKGLSYFAVARLPKPLGLSETRYFMDFQWPEEQGGVRQRAAILNSLTKDRRWEVPVEVVAGRWHQPVLHLCIDQCSTGWYAGTWLAHGDSLVRSTCTWDRLHTLQNCSGEAVAKAGCALLVYEWQQALSATRGPWGSCSHLQQVAGAADELFTAVDPEHELFDIFYKDICHDFGEEKSADYGLAAHRQKIWTRCRSLFNGIKVGKIPQRNRWFATSLSFLGQQETLSLMAMVLIYWGMRRGKWSSLQSSPLAKNPEFDEPAPAADAAAPGEAGEGAGGSASSAGPAADADAEPATRAAAMKQLRNRRNNKPEQLVFATAVFSSLRGRMVMEALLKLETPFREAFLREMTLYHAPRSTVELIKEVTGGSFQKVFQAMWTELLSPGFANLASCSRGAPPAWLQTLDQHVCNHAYAYVTHFTGIMGHFDLLYTRLPPYAMVPLLGEDWRPCMEYLKTCWKVLSILEKDMTEPPTAWAWWKDLYFPGNGWTRELFIALAEAQWKFVPKQVVAELTLWLKTQHTTLLNESLNRHVRMQEKASEVGNLSAAMLWSQCTTAPLLGEFGRPPPPVTSAARFAGRAAAEYKERDFMSQNAEPAFDFETLSSLTSANPIWPNLSPQGHRRIGMAWELTLAAEGKLANFGPTVLNQLPVPGTLLRYKQETGVLVVYSCKFGVLVMSMRTVREEEHGEIIVSPVFAPAGPWLRWLRIVPPLADWQSMAIKAVPPSNAAFRASSREALRLWPQAKHNSLAAVAAARGFVGFTVEDLLSLHGFLKIEGKAPRTKAPLIACIFRYVVEGVTEAEIQAAIEADPEQDVEDVTVTGVSPDDMPVEDMEEESLNEVLELAREQAARRSRAAENRRAVAVAAVAPVAPPALVPQPIPVPLRWTQRLAKGYCPPGCLLSLHRVGGFRWSILFQAHLPGERSKAFTDVKDKSATDALLFVLNIAWGCYTRATGEQCPWLLDPDEPGL